MYSPALTVSSRVAFWKKTVWLRELILHFSPEIQMICFKKRGMSWVARGIWVGEDTPQIHWNSLIKNIFRKEGYHPIRLTLCLSLVCEPILLSLSRSPSHLLQIVAVCEQIFFHLSRFWASLPLAACELSLSHSGSLWLFLVVSSSLWFPLTLTGSLCGSLWLSVTPILATTGSHCHSLAYSGPLSHFIPVWCWITHKKF